MIDFALWAALTTGLALLGAGLWHVFTSPEIVNSRKAVAAFICLQVGQLIVTLVLSGIIQ